jgi:hypothetical protein
MDGADSFAISASLRRVGSHHGRQRAWQVGEFHDVCIRVGGMLLISDVCDLSGPSKCSLTLVVSMVTLRRGQSIPEGLFAGVLGAVVRLVGLQLGQGWAGLP